MYRFMFYFLLFLLCVQRKLLNHESSPCGKSLRDKKGQGCFKNKLNLTLRLRLIQVIERSQKRVLPCICSFLWRGFLKGGALHFFHSFDTESSTFSPCTRALGAPPHFPSLSYYPLNFRHGKSLNLWIKLIA